MFTGLIREFAHVKNYTNQKLSLKADYKPGIGDSIAINGACLTVISLELNGFSVELSEESANLLAVENLTGKVHLEPAMRLSDRVEGHILQGHVDGIGEITRIDKTGIGTDFYITPPADIMALCVPKGSIAIDGVSLTLNDTRGDSFRLTIIPHTMKQTLFGDYTTKRKVNIETDIFVRTVQHLMKTDSTHLSWEAVERIQFQY